MTPIDIDRPPMGFRPAWYEAAIAMDAAEDHQDTRRSLQILTGLLIAVVVACIVAAAIFV